MEPCIAQALALTCHAASQLSGSYMPLSILETSIKSNNSKADIGKKISEWCEFEWTEFIDSFYFPMIREKRHKRHIIDKLSARKVNLANEIHRHIQSTSRAGGEIICINNSRYPRLLQEIENPPLSISILGCQERFSDRCVGVVGARKASLYAIRQSYDLGLSLAQNNICVVSGGAYGCDIASHQGVLSLETGELLRAIIVFAGGLSKLYPVGNEGVFAQLLKRGAAFVSERLWHADARPYDFPIRNRIISGLASELILMEASDRSGSMSTCRTALDQGREVLVMRPQSSNTQAEGSQQLISDGAYTFKDPKDLMSQYSFAND